MIMMTALLLGCCAPWPRVGDIRPADANDSFGLIGLETAIDSTDGVDGALHLFLVHGMSNHPFGPEENFQRRFGVSCYGDLLPKVRDPEWRRANEARLVESIITSQFDPLVTNLASRLAIKPVQHEPCRLTWLGNPDNPHGYQLRWEFAGRTASGKTRRMVVHLNNWSLTTIHSKLQLLEDDTYPERNAFFANKKIKDAMVTWGLMDAAMYVGQGRARMQAPVADGLKLVAREDLKRGRFAFGAASLGSIITLDTMTRITRSLDPDMTAALFKGDLPLYLFANQIPLLGPAAERSLEQMTNPAYRASLTSPVSDSLGQFAAQAVREGKTGDSRPILSVLAFNDPADLLGYRVNPPKASDDVTVRVANVTTHNRGWGIWGIVTNPYSAHAGFPETSGVIKLMLRDLEVNPGKEGAPWASARSGQVCGSEPERP